MKSQDTLIVGLSDGKRVTGFISKNDGKGGNSNQLKITAEVEFKRIWPRNGQTLIARLSDLHCPLRSADPGNPSFAYSNTLAECKPRAAGTSLRNGQVHRAR
jgi:hypothetical protein